eukprot:CAMPEP_0183720026 /NCGR_PEP_ID=MMETSP0737-20130205/12760_1 /TAXON_ID=385413 /ORGANISM="Thalassiosira miniscula, Strain CCMP1093" /LENGTH=777 /DNA_ID=CAMNT_0025949833 /DNA_START=40 /DNA_END=2373 /DNA_ORIENTATION=-
MCPNTSIQKGSDDANNNDKLSSQKTMKTSKYDSFDNESDDDHHDHDHGGHDGHAMRSGLGWGRGIVADVKRTLLTHWKEEMINLNGKTIACSFFLYFACIAPAVTFGAIYGKATNNNIGAVEMIAATSWCGIVYALAGGQPMMINGGTGPVLAFSEILYKISKGMDVPFLTLNAWIGIWVCVYMVLSAVVDLNRIIVLCTRFTDEIFSFLIALIFIINAIGSPFSQTGVIHYFDSDHKAHDPYENQSYYSHYASALLSLIVFLGTTYVAFLLRKFKFSPFLPNQTSRNAMTDFAVVISILIWSLIGNAFEEIPIEKLNVPSKFAPTFQCCDASCTTSWPNDCYEQAEPYGYRSWVVNLGDLNGKGWVPFMAAGPAILAFMLIFLDDGITWHLINHPSHKLKHGDAYNYDTILIGVMVLVNSLLGLPWLVAATVRSLNHIHAMADKSPDGTILSVQETRLTHLGIHLLCLATIFALDVLKLIPVPVLYGVFLFMGLVSLGTNQFWGRMMMFFMQPSKYPVQPYTQYMRRGRMHLFTTIQLFFFALLYAVKSIKAIAIAFPILIAACIPIRLYVLPKIFTADELILIDSDPNTVKMWLANQQAEDDEEEPLIDDDDSDEFSKDNNEGDIESKHAQGAEETSSKPATTRKVRRKKTVSCPTGALMFTEEPSALGPQLKPQMFVGGNAGLFMTGTSPSVQTSADDSSAQTHDTLEGIDLATQQKGAQTRRRGRASREERRSNSCPVPNMMFEIELISPEEVKHSDGLPTLHEAQHSQHSSQ